MSSSMHFICWPSHPGSARLHDTVCQMKIVSLDGVTAFGGVRLLSMDFLQLLPKPAIKGESRCCPLQDHLRKLFCLQESLSPWRDFTLDMCEFLRVRNGMNGPNLPGLHFNGEHEKGVRTCANNQG